MKSVLIAADMEGIGGIEDYEGCLPSHPAAYARGRRLMTDEVLAVVEALREGGAERISVGDWHMVGTNIERERMPEGVEVRPIADLALTEAEPSFAKAAGGEALDGVVLIGHHAKTPSPQGFSSHSFIWEMEVELDGDSLSETQFFAQGLAAEGVPILAASGDRWLLEEMSDGELGGAHLVPVKEGEGRARATSIGATEAREKLSAAVGAALEGSVQPPPSRTFPAELRVSVAGEEIARATVAGADELLATFAGIFRESRVAREYRQLAALLPSGHDSRLKAARRRVGSLLATPTIRAKEKRWLAS